MNVSLDTEEDHGNHKMGLPRRGTQILWWLTLVMKTKTVWTHTVYFFFIQLTTLLLGSGTIDQSPVSPRVHARSPTRLNERMTYTIRLITGDLYK